MTQKKYDINEFEIQSGRIIDENGYASNIVDILKGDNAALNTLHDINSYSVRSGRIIGEDGKVYNLVDLLRGISNDRDKVTTDSMDVAKQTVQVNGVDTTMTAIKARPNRVDIFKVEGSGRNSAVRITPDETRFYAPASSSTSAMIIDKSDITVNSDMYLQSGAVLKVGTGLVIDQNGVAAGESYISNIYPKSWGKDDDGTESNAVKIWGALNNDKISLSCFEADSYGALMMRHLGQDKNYPSTTNTYSQMGINQNGQIQIFSNSQDSKKSSNAGIDIETNQSVSISSIKDSNSHGDSSVELRKNDSYLALDYNDDIKMVAPDVNISFEEGSDYNVAQFSKSEVNLGLRHFDSGAYPNKEIANARIKIHNTETISDINLSGQVNFQNLGSMGLEFTAEDIDYLSGKSLQENLIDMHNEIVELHSLVNALIESGGTKTVSENK